MGSLREAERNGSSLSTSSFDQKTTSVEDPATMTIEFLRARLLSERSVSKAAKERSQQLMKKVAELEHQLQLEVELRKRMEATRMDALLKYRIQLEGEYGQFFEPSCIAEHCYDGEDKAAALGRLMVDDLQGDRDQRERSFNVVSQSITPSGILSNGVASSRCETETTEFSMDQNHSSNEEHVGSNDDEWHDQAVRGNPMHQNHSNDGEYTGLNDDEHDQVVREKGVLAWGKGKGVRKHPDKDGLDWLGRSFSQRSVASSDGELHQKRWAGKSVRQLRKKESRVFCTNAELEASQVEYKHDLEERDIDSDREMDVDKILERQAEFIEQFEAEENAQREWEENFREQNLSLNGDTEDDKATRSSMEWKTTQDGEVEEDTSYSLKDSLSRPSLERQVDMYAVVLAPQSTGQSEMGTSRRKVINADSLGIDDGAFSQVDLVRKSCNGDVLQKAEAGSKVQDLENKQEIFPANSVSLSCLTVSCDNQVAADGKSVQYLPQTKALSLEDTSNPHFSRRAELGTHIDVQQSGIESRERPWLSWVNEDLYAKDLQNSLQILTSSLGGTLNAPVSSTSQTGTGSDVNAKDLQNSLHTLTSSLGGTFNAPVSSTSQTGTGSDVQHPAAQPRLRTHSWGDEGLDWRSGLRFSDDLLRDFSSGETFQKQMRAEDVSQQHYYGAHTQMPAWPELNGQWCGENVPTRLGTFPPLPGNRKLLHSAFSPVYANGDDVAAFINHRNSVDGGYDRVANVLHFLQIAKHEIESSNGGPQSLRLGYKGGFDGRGPLYAEPYYPSVYPTIRPLDNDGYSAAFPSGGPARHYGPEDAAQSKPGSYLTGSSRQRVAYPSKQVKN